MFRVVSFEKRNLGKNKRFSKFGKVGTFAENQEKSSDFRYWIPIPILSGIPDSKAQDLLFHMKKNFEFRIPDYLTRIYLGFWETAHLPLP